MSEEDQTPETPEGPFTGPENTYQQSQLQAAASMQEEADEPTEPTEPVEPEEPGDEPDGEPGEPE